MIRDCTPDDLHEVLDIEQRSFAHPYTRYVFQKYLRATFLVLEKQRILGYVIGVKMGCKGIIISLAVHPDHRRQGYGTRLVEAATERLDATVLEVQVRRGNTGAQRFYTSLGFQKSHVVPCYYGNGEDAVIMIKRAE
ncbi:MAG: GNAT family N-acetyltransferase [Thermoplasmatota archaeon]